MDFDLYFQHYLVDEFYIWFTFDFTLGLHLLLSSILNDYHFFKKNLWSYLLLQKTFRSLYCPSTARLKLFSQKQPPEVFYVKRCSQKFHKIHRKTGTRPTTLLKKETLAQVFSCEFCEISKNTFFTELLWMNASAQSLFSFECRGFKIRSPATRQGIP